MGKKGDIIGLEFLVLTFIYTLGGVLMSHIAIKDIYAGMPDAKDEINTKQADKFFASFVIPPALPIDELLNGTKFIVSGYKGVGKTSVLYYLQDRIRTQDSSACTSFIYFKSDFEEVKKSNMESVALKLTSLIDLSGDIQPNKVEYLHIWRWVIFKQIVDDSETYSNNLFEEDENWEKFVKTVNRISFSSENKRAISLSSLCVEMQVSPSSGISVSGKALLERVSKGENAFRKLINIVDECERLFKKLKRTDIPYYIFIDEMEAYYGDSDLFKRDLELIRDLLFTVHRINGFGQVHIIAATRNEITYAMDRFIQTRELNKILDGFSVHINWSYSNTTSYEHPIIKVLMKRIAVANQGREPMFEDWFPRKIYGKDTIHYILDNSWHKPRDIVRLLTAAQNDSLHCTDTVFTQATFDALKKEYSRKSLAEIRQELQSLYTSDEIEIIIRLLRGGPGIVTPEDIRKRAQKGSIARQLWDERHEEILEDLYRVGFWGNVKRSKSGYLWRWNHKGDTGVLVVDGWELAIHSALCKIGRAHV